MDILAEGVDVALRLRQDSDTSLVGTRLARIRYHVCASPEYVNQHGRPRTPAELAAHDCIRCSTRGYRTQWKFRAAAGAVEAVNIGGWLVCSNSLALHRQIHPERFRLHRLERFADPAVVECAGGNKVVCASSTRPGCADR